MNASTFLIQAKHKLRVEETDKKYVTLLYFVLREFTSCTFKEAIPLTLGEYRKNGGKIRYEYIYQYNESEEQLPNSVLRQKLAIVDLLKNIENQPKSPLMNLIWVEALMSMEKVSEKDLAYRVKKLKKLFINNKAG